MLRPQSSFLEQESQSNNNYLFILLLTIVDVINLRFSVVVIASMIGT